MSEGGPSLGKFLRESNLLYFYDIYQPRVRQESERRPNRRSSLLVENLNTIAMIVRERPSPMCHFSTGFEARLAKPVTGHVVGDIVVGLAGGDA